MSHNKVHTAAQRKAVIATWEEASKLDPKIVAIAKKYDLNGDGTFSLQEVQKMAEELNSAKEDTRRLTVLGGGLLFAIICLSASVFGLSFAAVESAKESHVMGRAEVDLEGNRLSTQSAEIMVKVCASSACVSSAAASGSTRRLQDDGNVVVGTLPRSTFLDVEDRAHDTNSKGLVTLNALGGSSKIEQMGHYEIRSIMMEDDGSHTITLFCDVCASKQTYTAICTPEDKKSCTIFDGVTAERRRLDTEEDFIRRNRGDARRAEPFRRLGKCGSNEV